MAQQFISNSTVTYDVALDGTTTVTHDITLQNLTSDYYASSYVLSLTGISPINPVSQENGQTLPVKVSDDNGTTSLEVDFPDAVVGKDSKREFSITFEDKTLVVKAGEVWEITTPKLADPNAFDFYSTIIKVPDSFGQVAYLSPAPTFKDQVGGKAVFSFDKSASVKTPITAAFGQFQVFSFNLTYHLENPLNQQAFINVALPPDTNYQKMNYTEINPVPSKVATDADGNWIATFDLKANQKVDVKAAGAVQLFASPLNFPKTSQSDLTADLQATDLWQVNDSQIKGLADKLKTPKAIYNYVVSTLTYDYSKAEPNIQRLGATGALQSPKNAICTEFTDLFVAIARAAGIPTREIEGYAYTDNPQIQPLSLVADVLHAWPEYWDTKEQQWIPVDPTWGSTSGIDYFSKLDLRHFAFVVHGGDPRKPYPAGSYKLGPNPQKDVNVTFGQLPVNRSSNIRIENDILSQLPFSDELISEKVKNTGPVAVYDSDLQIYFDNNLNLHKTIDVIPPYGEYDNIVSVPYSFLAQKTPSKVKVTINGVQKSEFSTYKTYVTISNMLMISLLIFFVIFMVYLKFRDAKTKKHS